MATVITRRRADAGPSGADRPRDRGAGRTRASFPRSPSGARRRLLYDLHGSPRANAIPAIPIVLDSPLAIAATTVFAMQSGGVRSGRRSRERGRGLFDFERLEFTRDVDGVEGAERAPRADDHHRGVRHGGGGAHPPPSRARRARSAQHDPHRRLSGGAHARAADRRAAADDQGVWRGGAASRARRSAQRVQRARRPRRASSLDRRSARALDHA